MGTNQVRPQYQAAPGSTEPTFALSRFLTSLISGVQGGQTPLYGNFLPTQAAQQALQEGIETGFPVDLSPLYAQATNNFQTNIAPAIQEQLGARYGIRLGTPVAETLSRAGRDVSLGTQAQALPFLEAAQARRLGTAQFVSGSQQQGLSQLLASIIGGLGTLKSGSGFQMPQYAPSGGQQAFNAASQLGGAFLGAYTNPYGTLRGM